MPEFAQDNKQEHCRAGPEGQIPALRSTFDKDLHNLLGLARSKGLTPAAAEDVVFDAFLSLRKKIKNGEWECQCIGDQCDPVNMSKYLAKTVKYRAKGYFLTRDQKNRVELDDETFENLLDHLQVEQSAEDLFETEIEEIQEQQLIINILIKAIKRLSTEYREIIIQQYFSQESLSTFSARINKTIATIYVSRTRARNALAKLVKEEMKNAEIDHIWLDETEN